MDALDCVITAALFCASALCIVVMVHCGRKYQSGAGLIVVGCLGWSIVSIISALIGPSMRMGIDHMRYFELLAVIGVCLILGRLGWRRER